MAPIWTVYGYVKSYAVNYDGVGSSRNILREFDNSADAHRFAQHIVEAGKAHDATVYPPGVTVFGGGEEEE